MAETTFVIEGTVDVRVTVNDNNGNLNFTVRVLETGPQDVIGDLRGFFFDLEGDCTNPDFTGALVTGEGTNTLDLGNGANMNGAAKQPFDFGVRLGTPGIAADDVQLASFTLNCNEPLTIDMLVGQRFGTRLTSVGPEDGARTGSVKIVDEPCIPICEDVTIDFDQFTPGQKVGNISLLGGALTVGVRGVENGEANTDNDAMIFDADQSPPASGGDNDLLAGNGNVLILTEDDDSTDPDDSFDGGVFRFNFSDPVNLTSVRVIDSEEGGLIRALDSDGDLIGTKAIPTTGNGGFQTIDLSQFDDVAELRVRLNGSGALDDLKLEFCRPCPCDDCLI